MFKTIKIGWNTYAIRKAEAVLNSGDTLAGQIDYDQHTITLRQENTLDQDNATLIHEVLHGISDMYSLELDEEVVTRLADALYTVIKDNGLRLEGGPLREIQG